MWAVFAISLTNRAPNFRISLREHPFVTQATTMQQNMSVLNICGPWGWKVQSASRPRKEAERGAIESFPLREKTVRCTFLGCNHSSSSFTAVTRKCRMERVEVEACCLMKRPEDAGSVRSLSFASESSLRPQLCTRNVSTCGRKRWQAVSCLV